jgi:3-dehydroquinate dehydratase II
LGRRRDLGDRLEREFKPETRAGLPLGGAATYKSANIFRRQPMPQTIYVLNGPNLNLLGTREPEKYGRATLAEVETLCKATAERFGLALDFRQSNMEGELVNWIQEAHAKKAAGIVLNPAGYTTTSIAILDALLAVSATVPTIECHITNIHTRESFRQNSYVSKAAKAVIAGFGIEGYALAITGLAGMIGAKEKRA